MTCMLGADVGGTKVAAGPVGRDGRLLAAPLVEATRVEDTPSFLAGLEGTLHLALAEFAEFEPKGIGLACAGTVDSRLGKVVASPNLPLEQELVVSDLESALGLPVVLENDVNAAVLAEAIAGAAAGLRHVVMLALGTGVGGGLLLEGRLYRGVGGAAGEIGHTIVEADGVQCLCGARGCLEMYASGKALVRYAAGRAGDRALDPDGALAALEARGRLTGGAVTRLARQGHPGALRAVDELAGWLGVGLVNLTNTFNPEMIVVGGGVGELGELLLEPARDFLRQNAMAPSRHQVRVAAAALGNKAGLVGGALAAWDTIGAPQAPPGACAGADG